jgi:hypothetical protein
MRDKFLDLPNAERREALGVAASNSGRPDAACPRMCGCPRVSRPILRALLAALPEQPSWTCVIGSEILDADPPAPSNCAE